MRHVILLATSALLTISACAGTPAPPSPASGPLLPSPAAPGSPVPAGGSDSPTATATLPPGVSAIIEVASGPIVLAASQDAVWVEAHRADIVTRVDPMQNIEVAKLMDVSAHCAVVEGGGFIWSTHASRGTATKIDPKSDAVTGTIKLSDACGVGADANDVWVTSPGAGKAVRYDAGTLAEKASVELGDLPFETVVGDEAVWAFGEAGGGTIWRIDPATNSVASNVAVPMAGGGLRLGFGSAWMAAREARAVYRIDPATTKVVATIQLPGLVGGIGVGPDAVWASGFGDGSIHRIDPATNAISGTFATTFGNLGPPLVAFDSVWVGALDANLLLRLDPMAFGR
jgi:DNA-binding beta-propeller fold protein YncE